MKADVAEYAEFRVVMSGAADRECTVDVVDSPAGEAAERGLSFPLDPLEAQSALAGAARTTKQWVQRKMEQDSLDPLRDIGSRLFSWLFGRRLLNLYQRSLEVAGHRGLGLRLRLQSEGPELMALPWEFLYDGQDFVALSGRSPLVRALGPKGPPVTLLPVQPPLRVLVVSEESDARLEGIRESLGTLQEQGAPLEWYSLEKATWKQVLEKLAQEPYHVLHYSGTAFYQDRDKYATVPGRAALALVREDGGPDLIPLERWMEVLRDNRHVRLVHLGGDDTSWFAGSLAPAVQAALGVAGHLTPDAQFNFTLGLYGALLAGKPLEAAVTQGRREIDQQVPGSREWGLPVFYMQTPDGAFMAPRETDRAKQFVSITLPREAVPSSDPSLRRRWKLLQSQLAIARGNLTALEQQQASGSASPAVVESQIQLTTDRIADLERELGKMAE